MGTVIQFPSIRGRAQGRRSVMTTTLIWVRTIGDRAAMPAALGIVALGAIGHLGG